MAKGDCIEVLLWNRRKLNPIARLYPVPGATGFAATMDGFVSGDPEALQVVRYADGWVHYTLEDLPERLSPAKVRAALAGSPQPKKSKSGA